jgi:serine/threonine-protein kinase
MLYELLTGRKPHTGESPIQVAYKHVHEDVPPPSREVPGIPPYVDALVARATARDRSLRPADAGVLLRQVHRVANALRAGVADDAELTEDLALPTAARAEPTEQLEVPARLPAAAEPTTALRTAPPPPEHRPPYDPQPAAPRRRRWRPVAALTLAVLLVAGLAGSAW